MGGFGSGRQGNRPTVEDCLTLDLGKLLRERCLLPCQRVHSTLRWTVVGTGREVASAGYEADLTDPAAAWLRLDFVSGKGEQSRTHECMVRLVTTRPRYGGMRWWFVCPVSGRRCGKLHLPPGAGTFAARRAWRLDHWSQRLSPLERARRTAANRADRIKRRLDGAGGRPTWDVPPRPKGMWRRTYERHVREIEEAEERADGLFWTRAEAIVSRTLRGR